MQSFQRFDRTTTLMIGLLVMSFLLATFDVRGQGGGIGTTMRDGAQTLFAPMQDAAAAVTRPVVGFMDALSDIASLRQENEALRLENDALKAQLDQGVSVEAELKHLKELVDLQDASDLPTVVARISSSGSSTFDHVRFINKGSADGISEGDAVVDARGLVGRVDLVFEHRAEVRLILDPNVQVFVRDQSTSQEGIVRGDNENDLLLRMSNVDEPVHADSVIVTAGSRFPPGITVGTVTKTASDDAGFGLVTGVVPAVSFSRLDYVIVVVGYSPLDAPSLEEQQNTDQPATEDGQPAGDGTTGDTTETTDTTGTTDTTTADQGGGGG
jgi:rod shape-determining protein MreC